MSSACDSAVCVYLMNGVRCSTSIVGLRGYSRFVQLVTVDLRSHGEFIGWSRQLSVYIETPKKNLLYMRWMEQSFHRRAKLRH
jgi:hypothetical protein